MADEPRDDEGRKDEREFPGGFLAGGYRRGGFFAGIMLVLVGVALLAAQWVPGLDLWLDLARSWPLLVIGAGVFLAVLGLATLTPDLAIPTCVIAGIGGILYWQNLTGDWASWAYAWTLIPGFVGLGMVLSGLLRLAFGGPARYMIVGGFSEVVASTVLFAIFGAFIGRVPWLVQYWPVALIVLGVWTIIRPRRWRRRE